MTFFARHDRWIALLGTVALTAGFMAGVLRPARLNATAIQNETSQIQAKLSVLSQQIVEHERLTEQFAQRRQQSYLPAQCIPAQAVAADVLNEVAELARESQVVIVRLEPLPQQDFGSYSAHPHLLVCHGDFGGLAKFVSRLETMPRLVTFNTVDLTRETNSLNRQVQANLRFNVYSRHSNSARTTKNTNSRMESSSDN